jgi:hypothetical protein
MEGAWLGVVEVVVCTTSIDSYAVTSCGERGGGMREVRVEGGGNHPRPGEELEWRVGVKGWSGVERWRARAKSHRGWLGAVAPAALETLPVLMRGHVRYFPRAMWWHRGKNSSGDGRAHVEEGNEDGAGVKFGDDSGRDGREVLENEQSFRSNQKKKQNRMTTLW